MKVFISWSGDASQLVALALRDWLPNVIQAIDPYVSSEDIDKGARWSTDISRELQDSSFGILCITPENLEAPWVNFEAGALSKSLEQSRVTPFLFDVQRTEVTGPLLQFQSTLAQEDDVRKMVRSLNQACDGSGVEDARLDSVFDVWWPHLEKALGEIQPATTAGKKSRPRTNDDLLAEVLELVRGQQKLLADPEALLPPSYLSFVLRERNEDLGLGPDPAAVADLERGWLDLERVVADQPEGAVPAAVVDAISAIEPPIHHILRRLSVAGIRARRRRPRPFESSTDT